MVVGWYHSHPGFGCWLSGVDINTQQVVYDLTTAFWSDTIALLLGDDSHGATLICWRFVQSFEQLNPRAVAVVVDPIQSVKGKVVIDAFR